MRYLAAYRASHVPRFSGNEFSKIQFEIALSQRCLWNAAQIQAAQRTNLSFEWRVFSGRMETLNGGAQGRAAAMFFLVGDQSASSDEESLRSVKMIERLLPVEYGWMPILNPIRDCLYPKGEPTNGWRIARVVRRVEFVTLPSLSARPRFLAEQEKVKRPSVLETDASKITENPNERKWNEALSVASEVRYLPDYRSRNPLSDLRSSRTLCLPVLGGISEIIGDSRRLFQEIDHASPVVISMAIHGVDCSGFQQDRSVAASWGRFIELVAGAVTNAGFSEYGPLRTAYDRYWLPESYVAALTIRVAARESLAAVGVAQHIASRLGGMRGFEVIPPSTPSGNEIDILGEPFDVLQSRWESSEQGEARNRIQKELVRMGIAETRAVECLNFLSRFRHVYTSKEIEQVLALPSADDWGLDGIETRIPPPFSESSRRHEPVVQYGGFSRAGDDRIRIGIIQRSPGVKDSNASHDLEGHHWHSMLKDDLTKHAFVVGSTGSGKTRTTLFLVRELKRLEVPFLVVEPVKTEYHDSLKSHVKGVRRLNLEGSKGLPSKDFLAFDPMRLQEGVTVARHASYLKSCFEAAFPMESWLALVLESGIREYYTDSRENGGCGLKLFSTGGPEAHTSKGSFVFPSLFTFEKYFCGRFLEKAFPSGGDNRLKQSADDHKNLFRRRFNNLMNGVFGIACTYADKCYLQEPSLLYEPFTRLLHQNAIVELDAVPDPEQKALIIAFLMTFLFERRQSDGAFPYLKHVLILEEAHRLLANTSGQRRGDSVGLDSRGKAISMFVDMLAEIRALGQGIVIVEQIPTKIVPDAVKNTDLKIMLRLTSKEDRDYLGEAMNFTEEQKRFVTSLRATGGEDIQFVAFEASNDQPTLLSLPLPNKRDWLYDEFF